MKRIGVISDTHGVVHPRVAELFRGVDHILHSGDIGGDHVLEELRAIAPLTAIPGNIDGVDDALLRVSLGGLRVLITHILPRPHDVSRHIAKSLREQPADVVVFGHSHLPHDEMVNGIRYFNPASAGPRRFDYPTSVGIFELEEGEWKARHIPLDARSAEALTKRMNQLSRNL